MTPFADALKSLHTTLVDSRNGYEEALKDAEGKGMTPLFRDMIALRDKDAAELSTQLVALGEKPETDGSFMTTVHRAIFSIRSLFGGLDESVLPGLIDGEKRVLSYYDEAIKAGQGQDLSKLTAQRSNLSRVIADMEQRKLAA